MGQGGTHQRQHLDTTTHCRPGLLGCIGGQGANALGCAQQCGTAEALSARAIGSMLYVAVKHAVLLCLPTACVLHERSSTLRRWSGVLGKQQR